MSGPGRQADAGAGTAGAGLSAPLDFEAFEEMSRSRLRFYAEELTPDAVSGNSNHWTTAATGLSGVLDRLHAAVSSVPEAEFRGAFPESLRDAHRGFAGGATRLGDALGRPAGRLDAAAPQLGDVRTRVAAAPAGGGLLQGFPSRYLFAEPSAELAALMESLYVPAVRQAVTVDPLPGPDAREGAGTSAAGAAGAGVRPGAGLAGIAGSAVDAGAGGDGRPASALPADDTIGREAGPAGNVAGAGAAAPGTEGTLARHADGAAADGAVAADRQGVSAADAGGAPSTAAPPGPGAAVDGGTSGGHSRGDAAGHGPPAHRSAGSPVAAGAPVPGGVADRPRDRGAHGRGLRAPERVCRPAVAAVAVPAARRCPAGRRVAGTWREGPQHRSRPPGLLRRRRLRGVASADRWARRCWAARAAGAGATRRGMTRPDSSPPSGTATS
ncbi:WXG100 family type VII secretion target [Tomitella gaofuii]|uniref:WXG100 family type VII secretion target n=1 Tax=Tomitella gaofuii TaxID=2760083 RepID=UPI0015FA1948|nr:hypothetical protein [Tomitella gaofuii]